MMKVMRPNMVLSLPNTGTDWLFNSICSVSEIKYSREFFNPVCNSKYENIFKPWFGCEMATCIEAIAKPISKKEYEWVLGNTWYRENFNYTKENYSSFKIEHHVNKFNCCIFYRKLSKSLPGLRGWNVVENWYCAMFQSLVLNAKSIDEPLKTLVEFGIDRAKSFEEQCVFAFLIYYAKLLLAAKEHNLPIVDYDALICGTDDEVDHEIQKIPGILTHLNPNDLVQKIIETRIEKERSRTLYCSSFIEETIKLMPEKIQSFYLGDIFSMKS